MFSKKQLVIISIVLAIIFHFGFYFNSYGRSLPILNNYPLYFMALISAIIMIFLYFGTYWRLDLKGNPITIIYDLLLIWIFICFFRSLLESNGLGGIKQLIFSNYLGLSLFPVLFFIVGININYFFITNKILLNYLIIATLISLFFYNYFELQLFLLLPIFYVIITIPLQPFWNRIFILFASISILIVSLTNRAGIIRILISYCIVIAYYFMMNVKINRKLLKLIVFCILMVPLVSLYLGIRGQSVFQTLFGENNEPYDQLNPYEDTRTLLYYEVFQDLKYNNALVFGKGMNGGYTSDSFVTYSRQMVEVGFLQILLKTGIVGFILYISVVISAIYKAINKSKNLFMKSLSLLLLGYILMIFLENIIAYNLLNVIIWIIVGMCHSEKLRGLSNQGIRDLFVNPNALVFD